MAGSEEPVAGIGLPEGDPDAVIDATANLDRMAGGFERAGHGFRRAVSSLPAWLGLASVAFDATASAYEQSAEEARAATDRARVAARVYAEELRESRERVRRLQRDARELEREIEEAERKANAAAEREREVRARTQDALLVAPLDGGGFSLADAARAEDAAEERRRWERVAEERREELERVRGEAEEEHREVRGAERRAALAVQDAAAEFPRIEGSAVPGTGRPAPERILDRYQVAEDEIVNWPPFPASLFKSEKMTRTEADLLNTLSGLKLLDFEDIRDDAGSVAAQNYPGTSEETQDGHQDAFRHTYWNVLLARRYGDTFARKFTSAHEGVPANPAAREAMDLHNNEVGRRIASDNPDADADELAALVRRAVERGDTIVVDRDGKLVYSDGIAEGETGYADEDVTDPGGKPAEPADSDDQAAGTGS